jgi:hypothetical protein
MLLHVKVLVRSSSYVLSYHSVVKVNEGADAILAIPWFVVVRLRQSDSMLVLRAAAQH